VALRNHYAGVVADLSLDAAPNAKLGDWSSTAAPVVFVGDDGHTKGA
jgi:N6-L-threonylcarbamoyladenine synthase